MAASEITNTTVSDGRVSNLISRVTAEHVAYLLIALIAGVLRFVNLGLAPLNPGEAQEALAIWNQWLPGNTAVAAGSPAYFSLTVFLTQVLGFSDSVMRLVPAIFGFALVLTPWFLRHRCGRLGALIAATLLAFSPLQTVTARTAGGQSIALFAGMIVFIAWLRFQESNSSESNSETSYSRRWLYVLAAALALGLTSAPLFVACLLTLAIAWLVQQVVGPALIRNDAGMRASLVRPSATEMRHAIVIGLATFLALATALLLALRGVGSSADIFANWADQFQFTQSANLITGPFAVLARYEVGLLLIGLPAAVWAAVKEKPFPIFLLYWALAALLLMLLQPGWMANVLLLTLPGYLLVGRFANDILVRQSSSWWWAFALAILFAGGVFYLNLVRYARLTGLQGVPSPAYHLLIGILALLAMLMLSLLLFSWDRAAAAKGLISGLLALLLVFTWGSAWWLSREAANDTRERWTSAGTDTDIRLIRDTAEELSWRASNSANDVELVSAVDTPALRWYLRDFDKATFGTALPGSTSSPVLITSSEYGPQVASSYLGAEYGYHHPNTVHTLGRIDALRWWFFRQSPIPVANETLVLWLRSDLAEASP